MSIFSSFIPLMEINLKSNVNILSAPIKKKNDGQMDVALLYSRLKVGHCNAWYQI
jgi:hypothetical protein